MIIRIVLVVVLINNACYGGHRGPSKAMWKISVYPFTSDYDFEIHIEVLGTKGAYRQIKIQNWGGKYVGNHKEDHVQMPYLGLPQTLKVKVTSMNNGWKMDKIVLLNPATLREYTTKHCACLIGGKKGALSKTVWLNVIEPQRNCVNKHMGNSKTLKCNDKCHCAYEGVCRITDGRCMQAGCAGGWHDASGGLDFMCQAPCEKMLFGPHCQSRCNCMNGEECDPVDGYCSSGCADDFLGRGCNIKCQPGFYMMEGKCDGVCRCRADFDCNMETGECHGNVQNIMTASGSCLEGWAGKSCEIDCTKRFGPNCAYRCHCEDDVQCDKNNGQCPDGCGLHYAGADCQLTCSAGTYIEKGESTCSGTCRCFKKSTCRVDGGFCIGGNCRTTRLTGPKCQTSCPKGKYHPLSRCQKDCRCRRPEHCRVTDGVCVKGGCSIGWIGVYCEKKCTAGYFGDNCLDQCHCASKTDVCDHRYGYCNSGCAKGYHGINCNDESVDVIETYHNEVTPAMWTGIGLLITVFVLSALIIILICCRSQSSSGSSHSIISVLTQKISGRRPESYKKKPLSETQIKQTFDYDNKSYKSGSKKQTNRTQDAASQKPSPPPRNADGHVFQKQSHNNGAKIPPSASGRAHDRYSEIKAVQNASYGWLDQLSYNTLCKISKAQRRRKQIARGPPEIMRRRLNDKISLIEDQLRTSKSIASEKKMNSASKTSKRDENGYQQSRANVDRQGKVPTKEDRSHISERTHVASQTKTSDRARADTDRRSREKSNGRVSDRQQRDESQRERPSPRKVEDIQGRSETSQKNRSQERRGERSRDVKERRVGESDRDSRATNRDRRDYTRDQRDRQSTERDPRQEQHRDERDKRSEDLSRRDKSRDRKESERMASRERREYEIRREYEMEKRRDQARREASRDRQRGEKERREYERQRRQASRDRRGTDRSEDDVSTRDIKRERYDDRREQRDDRRERERRYQEPEQRRDRSIEEHDDEQRRRERSRERSERSEGSEKRREHRRSEGQTENRPTQEPIRVRRDDTDVSSAKYSGGYASDLAAKRKIPKEVSDAVISRQSTGKQESSKASQTSTAISRDDQERTLTKEDGDKTVDKNIIDESSAVALYKGPPLRKEPTIRVRARIGQHQYVVERPLQTFLGKVYQAGAQTERKVPLDVSLSGRIHPVTSSGTSQRSIQAPPATSTVQTTAHRQVPAVLRVSVQAVRSPDGTIRKMQGARNPITLTGAGPSQKSIQSSEQPDNDRYY